MLISPQALLVPDWENEVFPINLTKEQIKNSPDIDSDKPVSRQEEIKLAEYYPWEKYWGSGMEFSSMSVPGLIALNATGGKAEAEGDPNLRSMGKVTGYNIKALDREIGDVDDFVLESILLDVFNCPIFLMPFFSVSIHTTYNSFEGFSLLGSAKRIIFSATL